MAYVENNEIKVGEWCKTTREVHSLSGYFEKGTIVKVIGRSYRGYDIEDRYGNKMLETGFDSVVKASSLDIMLAK